MAYGRIMSVSCTPRTDPRAPPRVLRGPAGEERGATGAGWPAEGSGGAWTLFESEGSEEGRGQEDGVPSAENQHQQFSRSANIDTASLMLLVLVGREEALALPGPAIGAAGLPISIATTRPSAPALSIKVMRLLPRAQHGAVVMVRMTKDTAPREAREKLFPFVSNKSKSRRAAAVADHR